MNLLEKLMADFLKIFFFLRLIYDNFSLSYKFIFLFIVVFGLEEKSFFLDTTNYEARGEIETINKSREMIAIQDYDVELFQEINARIFSEKMENEVSSKDYLAFVVFEH